MGIDGALPKDTSYNDFLVGKVQHSAGPATMWLPIAVSRQSLPCPKVDKVDSNQVVRRGMHERQLRAFADIRFLWPTVRVAD